MAHETEVGSCLLNNIFFYVLSKEIRVLFENSDLIPIVGFFDAVNCDKSIGIFVQFMETDFIRQTEWYQTNNTLLIKYYIV